MDLGRGINLQEVASQHQSSLSRRRKISMDDAARKTHRQTARIKSLAEDQARHGTPRAQAIVARIRKCLDRASHPNTPEAEVQASLRMSSRLMEQHNVTEADVIATEVAAADPSTLGGQSVVSITSPKPDGKVIYETWVRDVVCAMQIFFNCRSYSTRRQKSLDWTFYGIATNTLTAALAFEMVHNVIQEWSMLKLGFKNSYRLGVGSGLVQIAIKEKKDEERRAREQEAADIAGRQAREEQERQQELARVSNGQLGVSGEGDDNTCRDQKENVKVEEDPDVVIKDESVKEGSIKGEPIIIKDDPGNSHDDPWLIKGESEDDGSSDDNDVISVSNINVTSNKDEEQPLTADFGDELGHHIPGHPTQPPASRLGTWSELLSNTLATPEDNGNSSTLVCWKSPGELILFRNNADVVAEAYLRCQGKRVLKGRKRIPSIIDLSAFKEGQEDSKKIDVKRRRIEDVEKVPRVVHEELVMSE